MLKLTEFKFNGLPNFHHLIQVLLYTVLLCCLLTDFNTYL